MRVLLASLLLLCVTPALPAGATGEQDRTTNAEMTAIFDADQAAREHPASIDWTVLDAADRERRTRTQTLLDGGKLDSADDFYHAAYVFQHGDDPEDFLKAHALAIVAVARGRQCRACAPTTAMPP